MISQDDERPKKGAKGDKEKLRVRSHYLSEFYLKGFAPDDGSGELRVYSLQTDRQWPSTPRNAAIVKHLYETEHPSGTKDDAIEKFFADHVEGPAKSVIQKVLGGSTVLSNRERSLLIIYVSFSYLRVPESIAKIEKMRLDFAWKKTKELADKPDLLGPSLKKTGADAAYTLEEFQEFIRKEEGYKITINKNHVMADMLQLHNSLFEVLWPMKWRFLRAESGNHFITSDNPVSTFVPAHKSILSGGFTHKGAEVTFPLSKDVCLCGRWVGNEGDRLVKKNGVKKLNIQRIGCAQKFLFAPFFAEETVKDIHKCHVFKRRQQRD